MANLPPSAPRCECRCNVSQIDFLPANCPQGARETGKTNGGKVLNLCTYCFVRHPWRAQ